MIIYDFIDDFCQTLSKSKVKIWKKTMKILSNLGKLSNFFGDSKSMTNYLPFETNRRVLAQLVKKCKAVEDSYFQVQQKVKNQEKTRSETTCIFQKKCRPKSL